MIAQLLSFRSAILFLLGTSVISCYRLVAGPTTADRLVALNLVAAQVFTIMILLAVQSDLPVYLDVALVYDIFGFVGTLAFIRYYGHRGHREEHRIEGSWQ